MVQVSITTDKLVSGRRTPANRRLSMPRAWPGNDVYKLGAKLAMDSMDLLKMTKRKTAPSKAVITGRRDSWTAMSADRRSWPEINRYKLEAP